MYKTEVTKINIKNDYYVSIIFKRKDDEKLTINEISQLLKNYQNIPCYTLIHCTYDIGDTTYIFSRYTVGIFNKFLNNHNTFFYEDLGIKDLTFDYCKMRYTIEDIELKQINNFII